MIREIITIDESLCNGCGACVPNCPEGALQIIDGKARLISDLFCDGLGACIGHCPRGAISIERREAEPYDEKKVMENIVRQGPNVIGAHLHHLHSHGASKEHNEALEYLREHGIPVPQQAQPPQTLCGCAGMAVRSVKPVEAAAPSGVSAPPLRSHLRQWPVQLNLVPVMAPFFRDADILLAADCVPFAFPNFHEHFLKGRIALVGCPKLDDAAHYREKLTAIFKQNDIRSVTCVHMEVPCCFGLEKIAVEALSASGKHIPLHTVEVSIQGEILSST